MSKREFSDWSMACLPETKLTTSINLKVSESSLFDSYKMTGKSIQKMMLELRDQLDFVTKTKN
jgi:hypothetical protein